ncbi:nucleotidyltransferase domain-containing protein [Flavobacterium succinicans]|uniref:Polymerase nucleotidyl transferase domain-containing protein n=1 Tax=Flavobacterium succinicans TaxID=29536 RepID=A0A199XSR9_9FLAO|nr:nucleotidyltransferase domain-containing protein [Flavobacterium succinicans]OAZ04690.1 hypothetical protein FLB_05370 [Flavobacterium succinicans]
MAYKIINNFLNKHFQEIESVVLFGSYIDNPNKANDIDLLLISKNFLYSIKESFIFEDKKINVIKLNITEVFAILAKHYQQGDFYKLVFTRGVIIKDKLKDVQFVKNYINNSYPKKDAIIIANGLNECQYKIAESIEVLCNPLTLTAYFTIYSTVIFNIIDWVLLTNNIHNVKADNKYKSLFFKKQFPNENSKIENLILVAQENNQKIFLKELEYLTKELNIPIKEKYSNDLIFDDYSQSSLILYIEKLFDFNEIQQLIDKIKFENNELQFYIYQVDEDNQEEAGCYIVIDNSNLEIDNNKLKWITFFQNLFSNQQYTFPYNNIFCYPEIKFIGKENLKLVTQLLTNNCNTIHNNKFTKETYFLRCITEYILKYDIKIDDIYNYYLGKLNAKTRSSNYLTKNQKTTEIKFTSANQINEKRLLQLFRKTEKLNFNIYFPIFNDVPIWFHFQVIDLIISIILKNDFQKLFYIHCLKQINVQVSKL